MPLPKIDEANIKKPLCYDPARRKYIMFNEIVSRKEKIVPVDSLSETDFQKLVIERLKSGPDFKGGPMESPFMSRDDIIASIKRNDKYGQQFLEAEKSSLRDLLAWIQRSLDSS